MKNKQNEQNNKTYTKDKMKQEQGKLEKHIKRISKKEFKNKK